MYLVRQPMSGTITDSLKIMGYGLVGIAALAAYFILVPKRR